MDNRTYTNVKQLPSTVTVTVTNFDLNSLIDQNNLSEDSCLIVVEDKVYDLTLWIQGYLSCNQPPPNSLQNRSRSIYSDHSSSRPSPPPSPDINRNAHTPSNQTQSNPFDQLLAKAKIHPVEAGNLLRSIYEKQPDKIRLEDWIREYRIGDFTDDSSFIPHIPPFDNLISPSPSCNSTIHAQLVPSSSSSSSSSSCDPRSPPHPSTPFAASDSLIRGLASTGYIPADRSAPNGSNESNSVEGRLTISESMSSSSSQITNSRAPSSISTPSTSIRQRNPLDMAKDIVAYSEQQVINAQRGVGIANLSLSDAWTQLRKAQELYQYLELQAIEGCRPELDACYKFLQSNR